MGRYDLHQPCHPLSSQFCCLSVKRTNVIHISNFREYWKHLICKQAETAEHKDM
ncbi:hypothetical protein HYC85_029269 [Camellia sinensis]|uniref:Uncharacterized protein n=1 Tax=Camellia sinensis TaxID=4442 RepID=A0A7J7FZX8_CAMSI|nr:hypothetical protein HYC85_029269 [Camellia sinensis]